jgi:hypothetical protein
MSKPACPSIQVTIHAVAKQGIDEIILEGPQGERAFSIEFLQRLSPVLSELQRIAGGADAC